MYRVIGTLYILVPLLRKNMQTNLNPLTSIGNNSSQENSPRNSPDFATSPARLSWPACSRHTAACMHRFFHIFGRPGEPAVWFMSESGAIGSWQARTYVGLPITSSGSEADAGVRGLITVTYRFGALLHFVALMQKKHV